MMRKLLSVSLLIATLLALYNVYGDNTELVKQAETLACNGTCVRLLRAQRTPIAQSFTFQTSVQPLRTAEVNCERAMLLVGSFSCSLVR